LYDKYNKSHSQIGGFFGQKSICEKGAFSCPIKVDKKEKRRTQKPEKRPYPQKMGFMGSRMLKNRALAALFSALRRLS
jgi:hypothetical protein